MLAAIYTRFSSDRQSETSTQAQVRACEEFAFHNHMSIYQIYSDEAISGTEEKTESRLEYQRLLRDAKRGLFDTILIHKYDRIARSLEEHVRVDAFVKEEGIKIIAVAQNFGEGNEGDLSKHFMWAMSEYYSKNLAKEVKKGHKEVALKGLHNGGVAPFGYDIVDQKYIINDLEAGYVQKMFQAAIEGNGYKDLIQEMELAGIKGKRGKPMRYSSIYEILHNEKYTGTYLYSPDEEKGRYDRRLKPNAIRVPDAIPAIIDKTTFDKVQEIMEKRKHTGAGGTNAPYLCGGLVYCSCGAKMHVYTSRKPGYVYRVYRCGNHCGRVSAHVEDVDRVVLDYLRTLLTKENQQKISQFLKSYKGSRKDSVEGFYASVKLEISRKQREYETLMKNMSSSVLPEEVLSDIARRLQELKQEIKGLEEAEPPEDYSAETIHDWLEAIKAAPDAKAIRLLVKRIDLSKEDKKIDCRVESTLQSLLDTTFAEANEHLLQQKSLEELVTGTSVQVSQQPDMKMLFEYKKD